MPQQLAIPVLQVSYRHLKTPIGSPHQTAAYDDCIKQHRDKHGWMGEGWGACGRCAWRLNLGLTAGHEYIVRLTRVEVAKGGIACGRHLAITSAPCCFCRVLKAIIR